MRSWLVVLLLLGSLGAMSLPGAAQPRVFTTDPLIIFDETVIAPPAAGANSVLLSSGQSITLNCPAAAEGSGVLCPTQAAIDVPENATGVSIQISANADFIYFIRVGEEVAIENGSAVADVGFRSNNGAANLFIPAFQPGSQFPGLQPGQRYFFAVAHFETSPIAFTATPGTRVLRTLTLDGPSEFTCTAFEIMCNQQYAIEVTRESQLSFEIRGEGNFQVLARRDNLVELPPLTFDANGVGQLGNPLFDHLASSDNNTASIVIDAASAPPLQPGVYYLAFLNLEIFDQNFSITTSLSGQTQPQPQPPSAGFGFSPLEPRAGQAVQFTDASSTDSGEIVSWSWDFGDGQTSAEQSPAHTYAAPGAYRVSLLVFDDADASDTVSQTITVLPNETPTVTGDVTVIAFAQLSLSDPDAWERTVQDGCVIYANISDALATIQVVRLDGQVQQIEVDAGQSVLVCGNAVHLNNG